MEMLRPTLDLIAINDWFRIESVGVEDAGKFICSLQTYPKQTLIVYLQVQGE